MVTGILVWAARALTLGENRTLSWLFVLGIAGTVDLWL